MIKQTYLKVINKFLLTIVIGLTLYVIGVFMYLYINDPAKYHSPNPNEAYPQLYAALTQKLLANPNSAFVNELKLAYADGIITESEFTKIALKHNLSVPFDMYLIFDETKQKFHQTWLQHQSNV